MRFAIPGAVEPNDDVFDQGIAWHYGDPLREQRVLVAGEGIVDISNRGVLRVTGEDRLSWLHSLTTQHVSDMKAGDSALALILDAHGHVEHELHLIDDGGATWVIAQPHDTEPLRAHLDSMRFMLRVEVTDVSEAYAVVFEPVNEPDPSHPTWVTPAEFAARGYVGREVVLPVADAEQRLLVAQARAGSWALEALRVAARVPRLGRETDERAMPHELHWVPVAVHLDKGCYRGQETVAKVQNLGQPPRRLSLLHIDGSAPVRPRHCDKVMRDGREVGWIGTVVEHFELGPIASAVMKRNVPADAELTVDVDGIAVAVTEEPPLVDEADEARRAAIEAARRSLAHSQVSSAGRTSLM